MLFGVLGSYGAGSASMILSDRGKACSGVFFMFKKFGFLFLFCLFFLFFFDFFLNFLFFGVGRFFFKYTS